MKRAIVSKRRGGRIEAAPLSEQRAISLCSCCKSLPSCTFTRDHGQRILQCEEFDGVLLPRPRVMFRRKRIAAAPPPAPSDSHLGLCGLCEDRLTCTYPKPEGGVWHCEEYR